VALRRRWFLAKRVCRRHTELVGPPGKDFAGGARPRIGEEREFLRGADGSAPTPFGLGGFRVGGFCADGCSAGSFRADGCSAGSFRARRNTKRLPKRFPLPGCLVYDGTCGYDSVVRKDCAQGLCTKAVRIGYVRKLCVEAVWIGGRSLRKALPYARIALFGSVIRLREVSFYL